MLSDTTRAQIDGLIKKSKVVLFMKGNKHFPQCGFSAQVVQILGGLGVPYDTVNVLSDPALRDGIKEFSDWPTIPQLYVGGEFVGGCDIVKDMFAQGELQKLLGVKPAEPAAPPSISITPSAAKAFKEADDGSGDKLRLEISPGFQYDLHFGPKRPGDVEVEASGVVVLFDAGSATRANGLTIDFVDSKDGGAFRMDNPNEPAAVKPLSVTELKAWMDKGTSFHMFDVRPDGERAKAKISVAVQLDEAGEAALRAVPKDTTIVFQCHHGGRSRAAAERFLSEGYKRVYNLEGGIDAWSQQIDPSIARY